MADKKKVNNVKNKTDNIIESGNKTTVKKDVKVSNSKSVVSKSTSKKKNGSNSVKVKQTGVKKQVPKKSVAKKNDTDNTNYKNVVKTDALKKDSKKAKAIEKSRQANSKKQVETAKRKKKEATRVIPVEEILKEQKKIEKKKKVNAKNIKVKPKNKIRVKSKKKNYFNIFKQNVLAIKNRLKNKIIKPNKKSTSVDTFKMRKVFIGVAVICIIILLIEGIYFLVIRNKVENNTIHYDSLNSLTLDNTDIVAVGSSHFKYSNHNDYTKGVEKAKLVKYDKNGKVIFEKVYERGISSTFSSVIEVEDGYVAVGSYEKDEQQARDGLRDALIVKYDKEGNEVWHKTFTSLTDSQFNKVIKVNDGYVVIGKSLLAPMEIGNSTEGGGVIIKYGFDGEEVWKKYHGGTKSANFNGIVEVDGNFYVVGRDGTDFGNLVKFSSNGDYQWHKNYRYTDTLGLLDVVYAEGKLYAVGSKKVFDHEVDDESERDTTNTNGLIIRFNLNGDVEFEKTFGGTSLERYNSIIEYRNSLFIVGSSNSTDSGLKIFTDGEKTTGILMKYDFEGNIERKMVFGGSNQDNLTDIVTDNSNLYMTAYTNSKDGNIITSVDNGKDYFGRLIKVNAKLKMLFLK